MRLKLKFILLISLIIISCSENESNQSTNNQVQSNFISSVDISYFPKIELFDPIFKNESGDIISFLNFLKLKGVNTIRIRLWVNPSNQHSSFEEVKSFSDSLKSLGFNIYLALHFSDTWADPGHQIIPEIWENNSFDALKNIVYDYTQMIVQQINPDIIQLGNEINNGFLHPIGNIHTNPNQFKDLIRESLRAVRENSVNETRIMLHYAGHQESVNFFNFFEDLDYDIIGISYYPIWHGKSLAELEQNLIQLRADTNKDIMIAETAYPFTLGWNDWTNNIVGLEEHLILPQYPASPVGQKKFIEDLKTMILNIEGGIGFSYWGAELIAWDGPESNEGSPWENQALFDFDNQALPVLDLFQN